MSRKRTKVRKYKRKSNRIIEKKANKKSSPNEKKVPIRVSSRLRQNHSGSTERKLEFTESSLSQNQTIDDDQRPIQYQYYLCPQEFTCADFSKLQCSQYGLFSCFCCDNFRENKPFLRSSNQVDANPKEYGCRRLLGIKVKVKFSSAGN